MGGLGKKNTKSIIKRGFANMSILTKLKYASLSRFEKKKRLLIQSSTEYCSVVWHENLTIAQ